MLSRLIPVTLCLLTAFPAHSASFDDPTWPCVQRKVLHLSVGMMWTGPLIEDAQLSAWRRDEEVARIAPLLAVRRTSDEEAGRLIDDFAVSGAEDKAERLTLLFAGVFNLIDRERTDIISGIARYAGTQTELTDAIDLTTKELDALRAVENPDFDQQDRIDELEDKFLWQTRIFKDRAQSLTHVCETPVLLEKRAFSIARMIQSQLDE